jgi:hypothetical protein
VFALVAVLLVGAPTAFATDLLANGSFETGDFSGWTTGGNFEFTQVSSGPFYVYSGAEDGNFYVTMGPVGSDGTLSQTFSDIAGQHYTVSFWMAAAGDDPSDFSAYWDGTQVFGQTDPNTNGAWTLFSFNETATGSDTISFAFRDDPAYIALDNVSVGPCCSQTPEPSSLLLLGSGLLTVGGVIRRKFQANR